MLLMTEKQQSYTSVPFIIQIVVTNIVYYSYRDEMCLYMCKYFS